MSRSSAYLDRGGTRLLALSPAVLWLTCGLLATASAAGLLVLAAGDPAPFARGTVVRSRA